MQRLALVCNLLGLYSCLHLIKQRLVGLIQSVALFLQQLGARHRCTVKLVLQAFALVCNLLCLDGCLHLIKQGPVGLIQGIALLLQQLGTRHRCTVKLVLQAFALVQSCDLILGHPVGL